jgi:hypothetical protein
LLLRQEKAIYVLRYLTATNVEGKSWAIRLRGWSYQLSFFLIFSTNFDLSPRTMALRHWKTKRRRLPKISTNLRDVGSLQTTRSSVKKRSAPCNHEEKLFENYSQSEPLVAHQTKNEGASKRICST